MRISIESLGLTATLLCRLLMKVPQMLSRKCEVEVGYFLGIQALRALLSSVSTPTKRWTVERSLRTGVIIGYREGQALFTILAAVAQLERNIIRERITAGVANARAKGRTLAGPCASWTGRRLPR